MSPYGGLSLRGGTAALPRVGNWKLEIGKQCKWPHMFLSCSFAVAAVQHLEYAFSRHLQLFPHIRRLTVYSQLKTFICGFVSRSSYTVPHTSFVPKTRRTFSRHYSLYKVTYWLELSDRMTSLGLASDGQGLSVDWGSEHKDGLQECRLHQHVQSARQVWGLGGRRNVLVSTVRPRHALYQVSFTYTHRNVVRT